MRRLLFLAVAASFVPACGGGGGGGIPPFVPNFMASMVQLDTGAGEASDVRIASSGRQVYTAWGDTRNGLLDIYFRASRNGGRTWSTPEIRLDTDAAGSADSLIAAVHAQGDNVYVVWFDLRDGANQDIYFNRSLDGGQTWLASDVRLDTDAPGGGDSIDVRLAASGLNVYAVWTDYRDGWPDIRFNSSTNGGATWRVSDVMINQTPAGTFTSGWPRLSIEGSKVYCIYEDRRNGAHDIFLNYSLDGGDTWLPSDVKVNASPSGSLSFSRLPDIATVGDRVYAVWQESVVNSIDVVFNYSEDGGDTWQFTDTRLNSNLPSPPGGTFSDVAQICAEGDKVYVVWRDSRAPSGSDIYFNRSDDGGATWLPTDMRIEGTIGSGRSEPPRICCDGPNVYVAWEDDDVPANPDIYLTYSSDWGVTWPVADIRMDTDPVGSTQSTFGDLACSGASVYVAWTDWVGGLSYHAFVNGSTR